MTIVRNDDPTVTLIDVGPSVEVLFAEARARGRRRRSILVIILTTAVALIVALALVIASVTAQTGTKTNNSAAGAAATVSAIVIGPTGLTLVNAHDVTVDTIPYTDPRERITEVLTRALGRPRAAIATDTDGGWLSGADVLRWPGLSLYFDVGSPTRGIPVEVIATAKASGGIALQTTNRFAVGQDYYRVWGNSHDPKSTFIICAPHIVDGESGTNRVVIFGPKFGSTLTSSIWAPNVAIPC